MSSDEVKLTPKQEAFAQAYVECGNAAEAYRRSYNSRPDCPAQECAQRGHELLKHRDIAVRIDQLKATVAAKCEITLADIARMLTEDRQLAHKTEDAKAAAETSMALAKLLGHYTEKKHVTSDNRNHNVEERLSPSAEWVAGLLGSGETQKDKGSRSH